MKPGEVIEVSRGVRRIVAGNAGMMTGPGTNSYILGESDFAVLDPGPQDPVHAESLLTATGGNIRWIIVTHTHRDHSPLARDLAARTGAQLIGLPPPRDGRQDELFEPQRMPGDGEPLELGALTLTAIHTPGHASNCVCYLLERERLLFTGDHILEGVTPVILPPDGDMAAYMRSLDAVERYDFDGIAPGHGGIMPRGKRVIAALRAHRMLREGKVLRCLEGLDEATLQTLTPLVYDDVAVERHGWAQLTLEAHLLKLLGEGRVSRQHGAWRAISG